MEESGHVWHRLSEDEKLRRELQQRRQEIGQLTQQLQELKAAQRIRDVQEIEDLESQVGSGPGQDVFLFSSAPCLADLVVTVVTPNFSQTCSWMRFWRSRSWREDMRTPPKSCMRSCKNCCWTSDLYESTRPRYSNIFAIDLQTGLTLNFWHPSYISIIFSSRTKWLLRRGLYIYIYIYIKVYTYILLNYVISLD